MKLIYFWIIETTSVPARLEAFKIAVSPLRGKLISTACGSNLRHFHQNDTMSHFKQLVQLATHFGNQAFEYPDCPLVLKPLSTATLITDTTIQPLSGPTFA